MFHLSRAIVFIACLAAAVFVSWQIGLIGLVVAMIVIPNPFKIGNRQSKISNRSGGAQ